MASKAMSFQFLLSQVRNISAPLAGGTATFYEAGTTTPKTIWLDRDKDTEAANPYTLDANGTAQLFGDGVYKIVIKNAAGATVYTRDGINIVDVLSAGAERQSGDFADLNAAITAIGSTPTTLNISTTDFPLTGNATVPATLTLTTTYPGSIDQGAYTLTINSPFSAGRNQVFTGSGSVVFGSGSVDEIYPEWWGGFVGTSVADDRSTAIQAMVNCARQTVSRVRMSFGVGSYYFTNVNIPNTGADAFTYYEFGGAGIRKTLLRNSGSTDMFVDSADPTKTPAETGGGAVILSVHDLDILGGTGGAHGFHLGGQVYNSVFRNILGSTSGSNFRFDNTSNAGPFSNRFEHVLVNSTLDHGIFLSSGLATIFDNCYFQTIAAAGKAGVRLLGSGATFISCNGLDAGEYWAIIGATQAIDSFTGSIRTNFINCRYEDFGKVAVRLYTDSDQVEEVSFTMPVFIGASGYEYDIKAELTGAGYVDNALIRIIGGTHSVGTTSSVAPVYANKGNVVIDGGNLTTLTKDGVSAVAIPGFKFAGNQATRGVGTSVPALELHDVAIRYASQNAVGYAKIVPVSAMPTTGVWLNGDVAWKETGGIETWSGGFAGLANAKYILLGWRRLTDTNVGSTNHTINVDWAEMRVLTGQ